ncbi:hypothetical protein NBH19_08655 [Rhizobium sp. S95]|uniref:Uncharacterized protein n=1 Tax=Ciceribacter sichuanensis TaxID=2949647 RepID=A0AAJ1BWQ8_9HYPH|nr:MULTISPECIES: hypothetical protein [unclassified Ciceribacter]MCM2396148.1 hypothetical protein [Ciceribacter sp. S95]MCO5957701.1 hypothetical protein [Ciceribacter sp. S101]
MTRSKKRRRQNSKTMESGVGDIFAHSSAALSAAEHVRPAAVPLSVDLDKYRQHVAHLDMPEDRKTELLLSLYTIMRSFVDRAFGDDPVQQCRSHVDETQAKDETGIPPVIHFSDDPTEPDKDLSDAFHDAGTHRWRKR